MKCTYEHREKRIPHREQQPEIRGRQEKKKGSGALVETQVVEMSKGHTFFFIPPSSFHKYICLPNSMVSAMFFLPKAYTTGVPWRCWGGGIRNLSQTSVKIPSYCSESKNFLCNHNETVRNKHFKFLIRKVYNPYQCVRIKNQLLIYPKEISEMCIKTYVQW